MGPVEAGRRQAGAGRAKKGAAASAAAAWALGEAALRNLWLYYLLASLTYVPLSVLVAQVRHDGRAGGRRGERVAKAAAVKAPAALF